MLRKKIIGSILIYLVCEVWGHGMMLEPVQRSSLWRDDPTSPPNYDDNQLYCGGASIQWGTYDGKCGVCGDTYGDPHPQDNENGGKYGEGKVVKQYNRGDILETYVKLTMNHLGNFKYSICILEDPSQPESGEECFIPIKLENGNDQYDVSSNETDIRNKLQLPEDLVCDRCVLRWHYTAGNNWGDCGNGTSAEGCGPQETFRNCADIAIY